MALSSTTESQQKEKTLETPTVLHTAVQLHPLKKPGQKIDKWGLRQEYPTAINKAGWEGIFPRKHKEMKSKEC